EADVVTELRVFLAEFAAVQEELDGLPVTLRGQAGNDADERGDTDTEQSHPRDDRRPVAGQRVLLAGHRDEHRSVAVGDEQREERRATNDRSEEHTSELQS